MVWDRLSVGSPLGPMRELALQNYNTTPHNCVQRHRRRVKGVFWKLGGKCAGVSVATIACAKAVAGYV